MDPLDYLHLSRPPAQGLWPKLERLTLPGGYVTALMVHRPARPTGLPVVMLHGIQSHPGWFVGSATALAQAGHAVYQFQRRGSGSNAKARGHAQSPQQLLADLDEAVHYVLKANSAPRVHLVGISWGGKYVACYLLDRRRSALVRSFAAVAPGLVAQVDVPAGTKLSIALSAFLSPQKLYDIPLSQPELFTDNPEMREYIEVDAHRLKQASARFLVTSRRMDAMLGSAAKGAIATTGTLILARRDKIIRNAATKALLERLTGGKLRTVELPGAHTLEFESDPHPYYKALIASVSAHD